MTGYELRLAHFHRVGAAVHAVALSDDGRYVLAGSEHDVRLIDRRGEVAFGYERNGEAFRAVALAPGLRAGLAMERAGRLYRLDFGQEAPAGRAGRVPGTAVGIWEQEDDLYSLDFMPRTGDDNGLIALGHHAQGLTALDARGRLLWRLGPHDAPDTKGRTWHATISEDGRTIYAAALGGAALRDESRGNVVVAIDSAVGKPVSAVTVSAPVTLLASLPHGLGVATVHRDATRDSSDCWVTAHDAGLTRTLWSLRCPDGLVVTALAAAPGAAALVLGTNTGEVWRVGAYTGRVLARYDLLFASTVLSVAAAGNGEIVAGLANGQIAFLERVRDE
jgi:hypothetical protein